MKFEKEDFEQLERNDALISESVDRIKKTNEQEILDSADDVIVRGIAYVKETYEQALELANLRIELLNAAIQDQRRRQAAIPEPKKPFLYRFFPWIKKPYKK